LNKIIWWKLVHYGRIEKIEKIFVRSGKSPAEKIAVIFCQKSGGNSAKMSEIRPFLRWANMSAKEG
jgi:hypothetical protein